MTESNNLTFKEYFINNKYTSIHLLKISSIVFTVIATVIDIAVEINTGNKSNPIIVFISCELFGFGLASFIFIIAIYDGYVKANKTLNLFNSIDKYTKQQYSIELIKQPLNPKYWFMAFDIIYNDGGQKHLVDEQLLKQLLRRPT